MESSAILIRNEREANKLSAKIMLFSILVLLFVYVLEVVRVFQDDIKKLTPVFIITGFLLLIPSFIVLLLKLDARWIKYLIVTIASLAIAFINAYMSKDVVLLYIYPVTIASLYFSRALCLYSVIFSMISLSFSQIIGTQLKLFSAKDYIDNWLIPVLSRNLELVLLALIYIVLAGKTRRMLENVMSAEGQKQILNRLSSVIQKSSDVSTVLSDSVNQLSEIADSAIKVNEQIAENAGQAASGAEYTLKHVSEANQTVEYMSKDFNRIADESRKIAEISQQVNQWTDKSEKVIRNAVAEMQTIEAKTTETKDTIYTLGHRSSEIGKIVEVITGIAGQTNLLALNAAIESARAGEQGKGFAVVADEIRKLAEQSEKAAKEISVLIKQVLMDTEKAVIAMNDNSDMVRKGLEIINEVGSSFEKVSAGGREVNEKIQQVSVVTGKAAKDGEHVVNIVENIKEINYKNLTELQSIAAASEQQLASIQQIASSVETVEKMSRELLDVVSEQ